MGNLHDGHIALVKKAKELADKVIVSIFVNPLQFSPNEDLDAYPRTLESDLNKLKNINTDIVFTPMVDSIYPNGVEQHTQILVPQLAHILYGKSRPNIFTGAATIIFKMLLLINPDISISGEKDYQQWLIFKKMAEDFGLPGKILRHPTVREPSGLAMSSRNQYLNENEKAIASQIYKHMTSVKNSILAGNNNHDELCKESAEKLNLSGFMIDYFVVRHADTLIEKFSVKDPKVILVAGKLNDTWLIDTLLIDEDTL